MFHLIFIIYDTMEILYLAVGGGRAKKVDDEADVKYAVGGIANMALDSM